MQKLTDELKDAIKSMPIREKDKLLLRLIAKDKMLIKKLSFQLMEAGSTTDQRAEEIREMINRELPTNSEDYYTPGYLLMDMRGCNARISEHVKITKDKLGEVSLILYLLRLAFERFGPMLKRFPEYRAATFSRYIAARLKFVLSKLDRLHEDYQLEFEADLHYVIEQAMAFPPTKREIEIAELDLG